MPPQLLSFVSKNFDISTCASIPPHDHQATTSMDENYDVEGDVDEVSLKSVGVSILDGTSPSPSRDLLHENLDTIKKSRKDNHSRLVEACRTIIECLGEDPHREGLRSSPERMANALMYFTSGYDVTLKGKFILFFYHLGRFVAIG